MDEKCVYLYLRISESIFFPCVFSVGRSKDYTAPVSFVSAGLRKTATEEKEQQKQDSDDSDSDRDGVPAARESAPKKLQTVSLFLISNVYMYNPVYSVNVRKEVAHQFRTFFSFRIGVDV